MAEIISTSLTWTQEDAQKYFLQPLFVSNNDLSWFDVMTDISGSSIKLDKYAALKDITKAQTLACFEADGTQAANSNVTLNLDRLEVEHKQSAFSLMNHIKSQLMRKGISRNDLTGTLLMQIISELLMGGISRDFSTILWFGEKTGGSGTQALSNGVWEAIDGIPAAQQVAYSGTALTDLASLMDARTNELAGSDQKMFVSRAFADKYLAELVAAGTHTAAYTDLQKGIANLEYNGIPMEVKYDWDVNIAAYGATLSTNAPTATTNDKAVILLAKDAVAVATDMTIQDVDMWYNRDCKENRFRMNYSFGCALKDNSLAATITA
jgi:hypothetical protein|tara:strand:+ start:4283 stop:5251 length:969 start_codon:yes stop_codon:yes gene_type:complete